MVVTICMASMRIESRTSRGNGNEIPITISKKPKKTINCPKSTEGIVRLSKAPTRGLAGLSPKTFKVLGHWIGNGVGEYGGQAT